MSWFDASGIASLAKTALKEAQKTIDKALDIKEDEQRGSSQEPEKTEVQDDSDNFFATWGLKSANEKESIDVVRENKVTDTSSSRESSKGAGKGGMTTSIWGSFTGSFFDIPKTTEGEISIQYVASADQNPVSMQPKRGPLIRTTSLKHDSSNKETVMIAKKRKKSWDHTDILKTSEHDDTADLCDDQGECRAEEGFSRSKLVVENDDVVCDNEHCLVENELGVKTPVNSVEDEWETHKSVDLVTQRRDPATVNTFKFNRLSVISSESDKKSSESVEVIGSECGSSFTTSPDSDMGLLSPGMSTSSSVTGLRSCAAASSPDSVEVISDTPSSVEVIDEGSSGRTSQTTASPYVSPECAFPPSTLAVISQDMHSSVEVLEEKENLIAEKISPESVEVIPEEDEESVADDSYTSASESTATATVTVMEAINHPHPLATPLAEAGLISCRSDVTSDTPAATHTGCRIGLQLPLTSHSTETGSVITVVSSDVLRPSLHISATPVSKDKVVDAAAFTEDGSSLSDSRTLVGTDSSCEGTLMESSIEDVTSSAALQQQQQTSSYYVKTMLADAMGEDEPQSSLPRDQSPVSERSDMVKVESEQTSGHTSGDELETTTSSDIEIISSPNGDSSSTHSRHSPAKMLQRAARGKLAQAVAEREGISLSSCDNKFVVPPKVKGHQREPSETSSGGSDDSHCQEVEKLLKRVADMTEILESRETKLIEISRLNADLQENNAELKRQLETALQSNVIESQDIHQVTEEFTQRLSSLERKFQQAIREKETLRKQLDQARQDAASRLSKGELESLVAEKDEVIRELREEGEKLSKQQLQHSNIIKKLRTKEKENDNLIKSQKDQLEQLNLEVERLKRSLTAKEDVERTQIEAVHQLTAKTKHQEKELATLHSQLDDTNQKLETLKVSLEAASKELAENKKVILAKEDELSKVTHSVESIARQELESALKEAQRNSQEEREQLMATIDDLHHRLRQTEEEYSGKEAILRQETAELLRRLEAAEARSEELADSASGAMKPLLRQLEQLQANAVSRQSAFEKQERILTDTIGELQSRVSALSEQERMSREQNIFLQSQVSSLKIRLASANNELVQLENKLTCAQKQHAEFCSEKDKELHTLESLRQTMVDEMKELQRHLTSVEQQLSIERAATEAEKRKTSLLQEQLREKDAALEKERSGARMPSPLGTPRSSPTLSFGRVSLSDSVSSALWPQFPDDALESGSGSGRYGNVYDCLRSGNTTSLLEGLQAQLKLRDGEVQQLQWELSRREAERSALTGEVSALTARLEEQEGEVARLQELHNQFEDIQHKYDALLQMYGEKVEETQELRLDLQDVKEMYKSQIDQLLKKEPPA